MTEHVLSALTKRRTELAAQIQKADLALQVLMVDLTHLDATIRQFDPSNRLPPVSRRYQGERGHMTKAILSLLRHSKAPMTVRAVATQIMMDRGMEWKDKPAIFAMIAQVRVALLRQERHGVVAYEKGSDGTGVWSIAR